MTTFQVPDHFPAETSWVSACPGGLWEVRRRWLRERQRGDYTPMTGSLCKVKVRRKTVTGENTLHTASQEQESTASVDSSEQASSYPRSQDSVLQVQLDEWFVLRMGEGQCDITEGCLEGMRAGEMCEVRANQKYGLTLKHNFKIFYCKMTCIVKYIVILFFLAEIGRSIS